MDICFKELVNKILDFSVIKNLDIMNVTNMSYWI